MKKAGLFIIRQTFLKKHKSARSFYFPIKFKAKVFTASKIATSTVSFDKNASFVLDLFLLKNVSVVPVTNPFKPSALLGWSNTTTIMAIAKINSEAMKKVLKSTPPFLG